MTRPGAATDGTPLYEDRTRCAASIFNRPPASCCNFLVANALYWLEDFHVNGLRVDAVASMLYLNYSPDGQ